MEYSTDKCKKNMSHVASYCNSCGTCHDCLEAGIKSLQKELAEAKSYIKTLESLCNEVPKGVKR